MSEVASFEVHGADRKRLEGAVTAPDDAPIALDIGGGQIDLPPAAGAAVRRLLSGLAAGTPVHLLTDESELTTQEAAELLGISRTYVVRMIDSGNLPGHLVGTHRRLKARDVLRYKARREERLAGAAAVAEADVQAGVTYR